MKITQAGWQISILLFGSVLYDSHGNTIGPEWI